MSYIQANINIRKDLHQRLKKAVGQAGISYVLSLLAEKWLDEKVDISVKPIKEIKNVELE